MAVAGSKESFLSISRMSVIGRTTNSLWIQAPRLPHFAKDRFSLESRGFVENSYLWSLLWPVVKVLSSIRPSRLPRLDLFNDNGGRHGVLRWNSTELVRWSILVDEKVSIDFCSQHLLFIEFSLPSGISDGISHNSSTSPSLVTRYVSLVLRD